MEWDEAADIDVKKIEQIFNGEETDEDSENEKEKKFSKKSGNFSPFSLKIMIAL